MEYPHIHILNTFDLASLPDLDVAVLAALELFQKAPLPQMDLSAYRRPLVVGSGNAEATGRIVFQDIDAVFASESNYEDKLKRMSDIDGVVLVSASGEKHAPLIAKTAKQYGKPVTLITNTPRSTASQVLDLKHADQEYVFPKNREPYTYNTSTYMGMILGATREDPAAIYAFLQKRIASMEFPDFSRYNKFFLILPPHLSGIARMLQVKFIELFGRRIARDVETSEYMRHATTVVPSDELFISFGVENATWGKPENRFHVPLPEGAGYVAMMAVGYYVIGQIQKQHLPYFKEHLAAYTTEVSELFGHTIAPIVE
ncbi:hypothetical protein A3J43_00945 [Candidatus Uhrbacteria bacterium RIFCSPHIGHO2_12_FULL_54_23]|uniref:SIS domain-containing protein n=2 Tax=Candidatus Uhriibacteriota TaxID=1752732 RepID=A0A1F7UJY5_9BACT|nr:MAG: hypothetical protein A3J43_00945 [Candidatus Uhrbacteria bacterium RIFCSPHIGHO2_12_FULL_54_23]OGL91009.1 MAG: hypothetical protein A3J36_01705 [Candidatus Uhrbacteria bacterium RIFCSPLOWO2_02_FULL_54_37]